MLEEFPPNVETDNTDTSGAWAPLTAENLVYDSTREVSILDAVAPDLNGTEARRNPAIAALVECTPLYETLAALVVDYSHHPLHPVKFPPLKLFHDKLGENPSIDEYLRAVPNPSYFGTLVLNVKRLQERVAGLEAPIEQLNARVLDASQ